jgi:hypothetical protein
MTDITILSFNMRQCNYAMHALLNASHNTNIILMQEP